MVFLSLGSVRHESARYQIILLKVQLNPEQPKALACMPVPDLSDREHVL